MDWVAVWAAVLATAIMGFFGWTLFFPARARRAQSSASAAHGRIASGESMASSGAAEVIHRTRHAFQGMNEYLATGCFVLTARAVITLQPKLFAIAQVSKNCNRQPVSADAKAAKHALGCASASACQQVAAIVGEIVVGWHGLNLMVR